MKIISLTALFSIAFFICFSQRNQASELGKIRQLYNDYLKVEPTGDINQLNQILQKTQSFLQKKNMLSNQYLGLLYIMEGDAWLEAGEYSKSFPSLIKADSLCKLAFQPESPEALQAKRVLSWSYGYNGYPELERKLSYELLSIYSVNKQKNIIEIADLYHTIGFNFGNEGNRPEEQKLYKQGLELMETFTPQTSEQQQKKISILGLIYNSLSISQYANNQYEAALQNAKISLHYRNQFMKASPELATNWMIIGRSLYQTEKNIDSAVFYLDSAIALLGKKDPNGYSMRGSKYWVTYKGYKTDMLQRAGLADAVIVEATSVITSLSNMKARETGAGLVPIYCSLSSAYLQKGKLTEALAVMQELKSKVGHDPTVPLSFRMRMNTQYAVALSKAKPDVPVFKIFSNLVSQTGISLAYLTQKAASIQVTDPFEFLSEYSQAAEAMTEQALVTHNSALLLQGITIFRNVMASLQERDAYYFEAGVQENTGSEDLNVYDELLNVLYNAKGMMNESLRMQYAFAAIESSKANLLQVALSEDNYFSAVLSPTENTKRIELKTSLYAAIKKANETGIAAQDDIRKAKENYLTFIQSLKKKYPGHEYANRQMISETDSLLIKHKGVIINYFLGEEYLYSFIYNNGKASFTRKNILPDINEMIQSLRQNPKENNKADRAGSYTIYNWLIGDIPLNQELIVIPHKQLSLISFGMLITKQKGDSSPYLIEKCPVRYSYSASLLLPVTTTRQKEKAPLFFGGFASSQFDTVRNNQWFAMNSSTEESRDNAAPLTGTNKEVKAIADIVDGDTYLHTSPSVFLHHTADYRILHIATHAFIDNQHQCHFLFENDSANNSMVSGDEIAALPVHADMAVLSACNTGTGKINNNEGVISLGRSFFIAGCPSVVMSLWSVNDESTSQIMTAFYKHLQKGEAKDEALRNAQKEYIDQQTNRAKKDPYYWAGFVVVGDNTPIKNDIGLSDTYWILIAASIILLAAILLFYFRRRFSSSFT